MGLFVCWLKYVGKVDCIEIVDEDEDVGVFFVDDIYGLVYEIGFFVSFGENVVIYWKDVYLYECGWCGIILFFDYGEVFGFV